MPERIVTQVGAHRLTVSHLDKALWPAFSKAQVLDYYLRVAEALLPHVARRAASFVRCPAGADGPRFFTHSAPEGLPKWIVTTRKGERTHLVLDNPESLIAAVNHYCLEIHVPQWTAETGPDLHDRIVFDLDPGEGADLATCCRVALLLRRELRADHLQGLPVTSGGKGLHVYVGLNPPWRVDDAVGYAKSIAQRLTAAHRDLITHVRGPKARAGGKVLVDWAQNHSRSTTASPYTLRVREREDAPSVATPLSWDEVEAAGADAGGGGAGAGGGGDPRVLTFTPGDVAARVERDGDLIAALADPAPF
ncbi:MAG TPA: non-homologous end-joining DNA ligase [Actinospica sp.]|nr:non-homologous end-joining DNA ligase [Actinospica sp.]